MQPNPGSREADPETMRTVIDTNVPQSARVYDFLLGGRTTSARTVRWAQL
ncbi:MAG: hypothetical protein ACRDWI_05970 [Jiangellaceae bacterium]